MYTIYGGKMNIAIIFDIVKSTQYQESMNSHDLILTQLRKLLNTRITHDVNKIQFINGDQIRIIPVDYKSILETIFVIKNFFLTNNIEVHTAIGTGKTEVYDNLADGSAFIFATSAEVF